MKPTAEHTAFRDEALDLLRRHCGHLPAEEVLAVAAQMVGQIMAMQDQRTMTVERAAEIVWHNIEAGNAAAVDELVNKAGGTA